MSIRTKQFLLELVGILGILLIVAWIGGMGIALVKFGFVEFCCAFIGGLAIGYIYSRLARVMLKKLGGEASDTDISDVKQQLNEMVSKVGSCTINLSIFSTAVCSGIISFSGDLLITIDLKKAYRISSNQLKSIAFEDIEQEELCLLQLLNTYIGKIYGITVFRKLGHGDYKIILTNAKTPFIVPKSKLQEHFQTMITDIEALKENFFRAQAAKKLQGQEEAQKLQRQIELKDAPSEITNKISSLKKAILTADEDYQAYFNSMLDLIKKKHHKADSYVKSADKNISKFAHKLKLTLDDYDGKSKEIQCLINKFNAKVTKLNKNSGKLPEKATVKDQDSVNKIFNKIKKRNEELNNIQKKITELKATDFNNTEGNLNTAITKAGGQKPSNHAVNANGVQKSKLETSNSSSLSTRSTPNPTSSSSSSSGTNSRQPNGSSCALLPSPANAKNPEPKVNHPSPALMSSASSSTSSTAHSITTPNQGTELSSASSSTSKIEFITPKGALPPTLYLPISSPSPSPSPSESSSSSSSSSTVSKTDSLNHNHIKYNEEIIIASIRNAIDNLVGCHALSKDIAEDKFTPNEERTQNIEYIKTTCAGLLRFLGMSQLLLLKKEQKLPNCFKQLRNIMRHIAPIIYQALNNPNYLKIEINGLMAVIIEPLTQLQAVKQNQDFKNTFYYFFNNTTTQKVVKYLEQSNLFKQSKLMLHDNEQKTLSHIECLGIITEASKSFAKQLFTFNEKYHGALNNIIALYNFMAIVFNLLCIGKMWRTVLGNYIKPNEKVTKELLISKIPIAQKNNHLSDLEVSFYNKCRGFADDFSHNPAMQPMFMPHKVDQLFHDCLKINEGVNNQFQFQ